MSFPEPFGNAGGFNGGQVGYPQGQQQQGYGGYGAQQGSYGGGFPEAQGYGQPGAYGAAPGGGEAGGYYGGGAGPDGQQQQQQQQQEQEPRQFDEHGNPIEGGERGIGTMAGGAIAGFAANKLTGGQGGNFSSAIGGALLAQGAKMLYDRVKDNREDKQAAQQAQQYGGYTGGYGQGGYGQGGYGQGGYGQGGYGQGGYDNKGF